METPIELTALSLKILALLACCPAALEIRSDDMWLSKENAVLKNSTRGRQWSLLNTVAGLTSEGMPSCIQTWIFSTGYGPSSVGCSIFEIGEGSKLYPVLPCEWGSGCPYLPAIFGLRWANSSLLILCWPLQNLPWCVDFPSPSMPFQATVQICRQPLGTWLRRRGPGHSGSREPAKVSGSQREPVAGWPRHGGDEWTTVTGESEDWKNRERHGGGLHVSRSLISLKASDICLSWITQKNDLCVVRPGFLFVRSS